MSTVPVLKVLLPTDWVSVKRASTLIETTETKSASTAVVARSFFARECLPCDRSDGLGCLPSPARGNGWLRHAPSESRVTSSPSSATMAASFLAMLLPPFARGLVADEGEVWDDSRFARREIERFVASIKRALAKSQYSLHGPPVMTRLDFGGWSPNTPAVEPPCPPPSNAPSPDSALNVMRGATGGPASPRPSSGRPPNSGCAAWSGRWRR